MTTDNISINAIHPDARSQFLKNTSFSGETGTVQFIPVGMIHTAPQVRTVFNDKTIHELAADIQANGVLQPLIVQKSGQGYTLIIGERRLRAIKHLGAPMVPAIVADVSDERREELQAAENIQREDLSAKDLTGYIHKLWKKYGTVAAVAKVCNKHKSWVSKRLAIAMKIGPLTAELLDSNAKDIELIYSFSTLEKADEVAARALLPRLIDKTAGRPNVKAAIAKALSVEDAGEDADEGQGEDTTMDLFADAAPVESTDATNLRIAVDALRAIMDIPKDRSLAYKWDVAREQARNALAKIEPNPALSTILVH